MEELNVISGFIMDILIIFGFFIFVTTVKSEYHKDKRKERELIDAKIYQIRNKR